MPANKRIFYAGQYFAIAPDGTNAFTPVHGAQQVGVSIDYGLDPSLELGEISVYQQIEALPQITLTVQKLLDGYPLMYHLGTQGALSPTLAGRSRTKVIGGIPTFDDTQDSASGTPIAEHLVSGIFFSSESFTLPIDGFYTEDTTFIGNNFLSRDVQGGASSVIGAAFYNTDHPLAISGSGGIQRRQNMIFDGFALPTTFDVNGQVNTNLVTILPPDIPGISSSGLNPRPSDAFFTTPAQDVSVGVDLQRQALFEQGNKIPYWQFAQFPATVTCSIAVIETKYIGVNALGVGTLGNGNNITPRTIKFKITEGTYINLGTNNSLLRVDRTGGGTGGDNVVTTYNYQNFDDFLVGHPQDPTTAFRNLS